MRSRYERHTDLDDMLDRAGKLSVRTLIVDIEPLVSWWDELSGATFRKHLGFKSVDLLQLGTHPVTPEIL